MPIQGKCIFYCICFIFNTSHLVEFKLEGKYICILGFDYQYFKLQVLILEQILQRENSVVGE